MIIQCDQCQARFRLADEKIKETGTKVRCSKCKHVFAVMPPVPEPPKPVEETASTRMVDESPSPDQSVDREDFSSEAGGGEDRSSVDQEEGSDWSSETDEAPDSLAGSDQRAWGGTGADDEQSGSDFGFSDEQQPEQGQEESFAGGDSTEFEFDEEGSTFPSEEQDSSAAGEESSFGEIDFGEEQAGPSEFEFGEQSVATGESGPAEFDFDSDGQTETSDFTFDGSAETETEQTEAGGGDFSFGEQSDSAEFGFEDNSGFDAESGETDWTEDSTGADEPIAFDEPSFDSENPFGEEKKPKDELQFGEFDFSEDDAGSGPALSVDEDLSVAPKGQVKMEMSVEQPEPPRRSSSQPPGPAENAEKEGEKPKKKSSPAAVVLLLLVLVGLAGAGGYLYRQDLMIFARQVSFLQPYLPKSAEVEQPVKIDISITSTNYVTNKHAGQLLVVQGEAINKDKTSRSAITVKGVLLDSNGKNLKQQTVSCGNYLDEGRLREMPYAKIEDAMNNQFGDSLSNMNVAAKAKIPFTVVFRDLPEGIANINIELVDSKPGNM